MEHDHKTQKAGRGSKTKSNVMVMAESTILEDVETGKKIDNVDTLRPKCLMTIKLMV